jgi:hypothetical protein
MALKIRPAALRLVERRHVRHVIEPQQRRPVTASDVERDRERDSVEPTREGLGLLELTETTKCAQKGFVFPLLEKRATRTRASGRLSGCTFRYAVNTARIARSAFAGVSAAAYTGNPGTYALMAPLASVSRTMG